jgi:HK97 family phage major capsid protein
MNALTKEFTDAVEQQFAKLNADVQQALKSADTANHIIFDIEQKMAQRGGPEGVPIEQKSWGEQFTERAADELKNFAEDHSRPGRLRMELKTTITTDATSAGAAAGQAYRDSIVGMPTRQLRVRDLIPTVGISTGEFEFARQTVRTNAANTVAEGALKPESAYGWEMDRGTPKVIAHWVPASRQILDDAPQLRGLIDTELRYGLSLKEDAQLLAGDGTGQNLSGLIPNATAYSAPFTVTGGTMLDTIGLGMLQTTLADFMPTGIVMHPSDWMRIRLLKNADGEYLLGDPGSTVDPRLFGLPVVATTSMTIDKFLIGAFPQAATIYDRWAPRVEVSTEHADFFTRNLVAILCEQRLGLAVKQAKALVYGDFGNVA